MPKSIADQKLFTEYCLFCLISDTRIGRSCNVTNPKKMNRMPATIFQYWPMPVITNLPNKLKTNPVNSKVIITPSWKKPAAINSEFRLPSVATAPEYPITAVKTGTLQQDVTRPRKPSRQAVSKVAIL